MINEELNPQQLTEEEPTATENVDAAAEVESTAANATEQTTQNSREVAEMRDKYLRMAAEFDNFRKRTARERLELMNTAGKEIITALLPVLDDFERAFRMPEPDQKGFELIYNKIKTLLEQKGLKGMESVGQPFNADFHEAITEIPAPDESLRGKVVDEVERGYYLGDSIIRYAKVVVGN